MRITFGLDDDVTALIQQVRKVKAGSLRQILNTALREGLALYVKQPAPRKKFRTAVHSCGRCYLSSLDNTAEVLASIENELA